MKSFEQKAQAVWSAVSLTSKQILLLNMIQDFQYTAKQEIFRTKINAMTNVNQADKLASDLALRGEGLQVI